MLSVAWMTLAFTLLIGLGLSATFGSVRSHSKLLSWRESQQAIAESDLQAIKTVYEHANSRLSESELKLAKLTELDAKTQGTIELLTKGGELLFSQASDSTTLRAVAAEEASNRNRGEVASSWSVEPNGFNLLKSTCPLDASLTDGRELALARRFAVDEIQRLNVLEWLWVCMLCCTPIVVGLWMAKSRLVRKQFLGSLAVWSRLSTQASTALIHNEAISAMQCIDPSVATILQRASEGIYDRLESIQHSVEQTSRVMSAMPVGVLAFDQNLKLLFVNRAGIELLGLGTPVRFGQAMIEVIRQPNVVNLIQQVSSEPQVQEVELELPLSKATLRLRAHPLSNPDQSNGLITSTGVLLTLTDETRLKQLENARRDFTANVSHELKTPLSAIKAYAETLLMGALDDEEARKRFVERIAEQANRLDSLIRDLLQLTKLQSQPDKPQLSELLLDDVLKTCVEEHRTIGQAKRVSIDTSGVEHECRIEADLESLRTVIGNLLGNAVRYNRDEGWVRVSTRCESSHVIVTIADSGIGIPPEDLDRIFERFYRVEKARSQDAGGTGLGLSIVKHLVQSMSAEINVSSVLGKGSSFELKLKRAAFSR